MKLLRRLLYKTVVAVGILAFVENVKNKLGVKVTHRDVIEAEGGYGLREPSEAYAARFTGQNEALKEKKGSGVFFMFASDDHGISLSIQAQGVSL